MLRIENLVKKYGEKKAVDNLSLEIRPGELCGFIGHNGAGKTTTIKSCCGIISFDSGEIFVDGISVKQNVIEVKKRLAYIPDNPDMYDFMTGAKYLDFIADVYSVGKEDRKKRIEEYAQTFSIAENLGQQINSYSHGMKQKLAVISALIHKPKLLLLDEPFVGLDPVAAHSLKQIMRGLCDDGGAIFFSTHVLEVAEKICDRIAIIRNGSLVSQGTVEEVKGDSSLEDVFLELEEKDV